MKLLVTGADGFIGKNLTLALRARPDITVMPITRGDSAEALADAAKEADCIVHLAAIIRPQAGENCQENVDVAGQLVAALQGKKTPILFTSSTLISAETDYGISKRVAEDTLAAYGKTGAPVYIYRLPNVFGKFARPHFNSAIATFCHNVARDLPITINDARAPLSLVYIDNVVASFIDAIDGKVKPGLVEVAPQYQTTVGEVAAQIEAFKNVRSDLVTERVGEGLTRALYATYVSALPTEKFVYDVNEHADARGTFVEMLKTKDSGQFSFFTAHPGVTRGGHYHHSKTEKFLVISGKARFAFRHMVTHERHELVVTGNKAQIVETVPGWTHDVTNIGDNELVVMLWANEIFDRNRPDTYAEAV